MVRSFKDGLSSYEVAKRVKVEFGGVGPSARTIQRYANGGLAGLSPLKPGVKSDIPKWEKMKKSDMIARWKEIRRNHVPPPIFEKWGDSDEEELVRLKSTEVDMSETALGRYAALMKRQAFASVLDFTDEEWTNLKKLREEESTAMATTAEALPDDIGNSSGALGAENDVIVGESGAV